MGLSRRFAPLSAERTALCERCGLFPVYKDEEYDRLVKTVLKTFEKFPEMVVDAGLSLKYMAAIPDTHKHIVGYGGLDIAKSVLRHHLADEVPLVGYCIGSALEDMADPAMRDDPTECSLHTYHLL